LSINVTQFSVFRQQRPHMSALNSQLAGFSIGALMLIYYE